MKRAGFRAVLLTGLLIGLGTLIFPQTTAAIQPGVASQLGEVAKALPPATKASSASVTCSPNVSWNPDAGLGLVNCGAGSSVNRWSSLNAETESSTAVYFAWRNGTTKANYTTVGKKRCVGCNNGTAYQAEVTEGTTDLFCIATSATDAGVVISVECAK